jgi:ZIP family zinc transporter
MFIVLLAAIAAAAILCTYAGGLLALRLQDKLHLILGFSAGAVIGVAFFDLLPEALEFGVPSGSAASVVGWTGLGFLLYLAVDRILLFHRSADAHAAEAPPRGRFGAAVLCVHSFLDGGAIGLGFQSSHAVGVIVAIAVLTHDFSDGINTMNIVLKNRGDRAQALRWLALDAFAPAAGIGAASFVSLPHGGFGIVLALFSGFFLYIGASDLIPESYHAHPKFLTTATTVAGAAVIYFAVALAR